jgi:hypothetical protein
VASLILTAVPGAMRSGVQARKEGVSLELRGFGYRANVDIYGIGETQVNVDLRGMPAADAVRMLAALGDVEADRGPRPVAAPAGRRRRLVPRWLRSVPAAA